MKPTLKVKKAHLYIVLVIAFLSVGAFVVLSLQNKVQQDKANSEVLNMQSELFPVEGFDTGINLNDIVPQMVKAGIVDEMKFNALYESRGGMLAWQREVMTKPFEGTLKITNENSNFYLNLLWALGISNKNPVLGRLDTTDFGRMASTGGWSLSTNDAMFYFNTLELINLTPEQQAIVDEVADNAFRPCCDNPTSFPDCNHGAALLGLLQLGASQGMTKEQLYSLSLRMNTMWFPQQYMETALLFKTQGRDYWGSAQEIMSSKYSSYSGWARNVHAPLQVQGLIPTVEGGGGCGV